MVLWGLGVQHPEIPFHPFLRVCLVLPVDHSVHSVQESQVSQVAPVLLGSLEIQACQALPVVLAQSGWTLVDWERGSGWRCSEPSDLIRGRTFIIVVIIMVVLVRYSRGTVTHSG